MAAIYHEAQGNQFIVPVGSLGFSVTIFCIEVCEIVQLHNSGLLLVTLQYLELKLLL